LRIFKKFKIFIFNALKMPPANFLLSVLSHCYLGNRFFNLLDLLKFLLA
jgi:hypothetical protein